MNGNPQKIVTTIRKQWRTIGFTSFLLDSMSSLMKCGAKLSVDLLFPFSEVFSEVPREESCRLVMLGKKTVDEPFENSAFATVDATANKASNYQRKMDEKPRVWSDHCNWPCHT